MTDSTRAAVACVALSILSKQPVHALYDGATHRQVHFDASITPRSIRVYSHQIHVDLTGYQMGNSISLFNQTERSQIVINLSSTGFTAYDYGTRSHLQGSVMTKDLTTYDHQTRQSYIYRSA